MKPPARCVAAPLRSGIIGPKPIVDYLPVDSRQHAGDLVNISTEVLAGIVEAESASQMRRFFNGQSLALPGTRGSSQTYR
jgi:hypothetical protein